MPPRPRKTAAVKPDDAPAPDVVDTETPDADEDEPTSAVADEDPEATSPESSAPDAPILESANADDEATVIPEVAAPAFHWETPGGVLGEPCRLCLPGGPSATAGSIGCQHGQWVRVWEA